MKKINFLNESDVYDELMEKFPAQPSPFLPTDIRGLDDPECVYVFFKTNNGLK